MDKMKVINTIQQLFEDEQEIRFAYLFGSVASGKSHPGSDVDIAVCFSSDLNILQRFNFRLSLMDKLTAALSSDVDLVDLASAPLSLQHRIMLEGVLIMERNKKERVSFEVLSRREYFDLARHLDRRADAIISRI